MALLPPWNYFRLVLSTPDVGSYNRAESVNFYECYYRTKNTAVMSVKAYDG